MVHEPSLPLGLRSAPPIAGTSERSSPTAPPPSCVISPVSQRSKIVENRILRIPSRMRATSMKAPPRTSKNTTLHELRTHVTPMREATVTRGIAFGIEPAVGPGFAFRVRWIYRAADDLRRGRLCWIALSNAGRAWTIRALAMWRCTDFHQNPCDRDVRGFVRRARVGGHWCCSPRRRSRSCVDFSNSITACRATTHSAGFSARSIRSSSGRRFSASWPISLKPCEGVVAIDGKVLRRSFDRASGKSPLHMVSAWGCEQRLVLAQIATDAKSNEITAVPKVSLAMLQAEKERCDHGRVHIRQRAIAQ